MDCITLRQDKREKDLTSIPWGDSYSLVALLVQWQCPHCSSTVATTSPAKTNACLTLKFLYQFYTRHGDRKAKKEQISNSHAIAAILASLPFFSMINK